MRVFKSSVAQMGDECVEMIMRSICGKRPSGEEEEEEGEDDEFGSSGFEALREGGLGGSDVDVSMDGGEEEGEEEEEDRDMKDNDGEDDEEALQGQKADFATRGEVGGEENDAGVEEGGMAGGSSDGGTWQQPDHNIALSQADSEELREMDERMRAAHSLKSSAAHDATQVCAHSRLACLSTGAQSNNLLVYREFLLLSGLTLIDSCPRAEPPPEGEIRRPARGVGQGSPILDHVIQRDSTGYGLDRRLPR